MFFAPRLALLLAVALIACAAQATPAALIERSRAAMRVDPEASRQLAEQALRGLAASPDVDLQILAHLQLCDYYSERSREAAQQQIDSARPLLARARRPGLRAALLICEAEVHQYAADNVQAMALFRQAVAVAEAARDDEMLAEALYQIGYLRGVQGELANGLADLRRAIGILERLNLPMQRQTAVNAVAILYNRMGDYASARQYYEDALRAQKAKGLTRELVVTQHNLGRVLENLKDWDAAQRAFESVLALAREIGYRRGEAYALRGLASVRNAKESHSEAMTLLEQADQAQQGSPDERLRAQILLQRGIALRGLHELDASIGALRQALEIFRRAESLAEFAATHGELARALSAAGDWRAAYDEQEQFKNATDLLLQRQLDQRFATLRVEFDTEAKVKENVLLQRENAAVERALEQERRASQLRAVVLVLLALLAALLALLAWRQRRSGRAMQRLAMTDELTGLPNRRHMLARLDALLADPGRGGAVLIVDVDRFKSINDRYGHPVGDEILRLVARAMRETARAPIVLGRIGGEEFLLVVPDGDAAAADALANRLLAAVRDIDASRWLGERRLTVSIGLTVSAPGDTAAQMLRRADRALYAAKERGRNCVVANDARNDLPAIGAVRPV